MAYRDLPLPATCHPLTSAEAPCTDCGAPTCSDCLDFHGVGARCRRCTAAARRSRTVRTHALHALAGCAVAALVVAGLAVLLTKPPTAEERMERRRAFFGVSNPCVGGPKKAAEILELGAPSVALDHLERYVATCDPSAARELLGTRFLAHRALGAFADMVKDTELALAARPGEPFLRFWHIAALEEAGRLSEASHELSRVARAEAVHDWSKLMDPKAIDRDRRFQPYYEASGRDEVDRLDLADHRGFAGLSARIAIYYARLGPCIGATAEHRAREWFPSELPYAARYEAALTWRCNHPHQPSSLSLAIVWLGRGQ